MAVHDEKGVATTSFADIAQRAGVGPATVLRHFPTLGSLVMACGEHVAMEMRPPRPDAARETFAGLQATRARLERLVSELDAFYTRGALRLTAAANDRDRVPELDYFLKTVDAGIEAFIKEAIIHEKPTEPLVGVLMSFCSICVWQGIKRAGLTERERQAILVDLLIGLLLRFAQRDRQSSQSEPAQRPRESLGEGYERGPKTRSHSRRRRRRLQPAHRGG
jgi:AcrR family transcriptional regulator